MTLAIASAYPSAAFSQSNEELLKELRALRDRVNQLEERLKTKEASEAKPAAAQWGMTPQQAQDFNRIAVKTEALEDNTEAMGLKSLKISGYMDPSYIYNRNQNRAGFQFLNNVANATSGGYHYDNSYIGTVALDLLKETEGGTRWHLTLSPNRGTDAVIGNGGLVQEASVSIPLGDLQTRLIAGHMPDWSGYEMLQPTLNKLVTHNLLFDFTLPTAYTGAGVELTRGKWITKAILANLNSSMQPAGEKSPVIAYRVDYAKGEFDGFGFAGVHGKAANGVGGTGSTMLNLFEVDGYYIRGDLTLQGQLSYGGQKQASITPNPDSGALRDSEWMGFSGLAAYKFSPRFETIARFDYLKNSKNGGGLLGFGADPRNGIGPTITGRDADTGDLLFGDTERGATRTALSLGINYLYDLNTTFKLEYRYDRADRSVFELLKDGGFSKSNNLLGASVVVKF
ncbi:DUF3138 family protein [Roseateles oligotrophus]|uniref:DUF3138 family protein n=1 Tax=Roseateles oligotrophus TaxID=1769250 RepID=A0ABT2YMJ3_9BURK|nr:DUF3138 family protein [Roseateles oligotrophus]MCV2371276.1 DUF3138 family protein [Roseateles oligotrophus]